MSGQIGVFLEIICPFYALILTVGCSPELVALTEKLLFPDECSVGEGQHGIDTDTFTGSHGVDFTVTTHLGREIFTIHQSF